MQKDLIHNDPLTDEEENRSVSVGVTVRISVAQPDDQPEI
ncbi:hypothetical protein SAMN05216499_12097 [Actinacidiphila paucisporea]|uniref:Uncharacterized protein n=1 Tax=Actinacidiphila paucisporea TaxID=310782 RepID=A0A1M7P0R7_9ACTN|nr:hypothetical protein SAMN05216499_12097 [Actinacidiphila paucisporea]